MVGRVELRPGYHVLPKQAGTAQSSLVEKLILGPEGEEIAASAAEGELTVEHYSDVGYDDWYFTERWPYRVDGQPSNLRLSVNFSSYAFPGGFPTGPIDIVDQPGTAIEAVLGGARLDTGDPPITDLNQVFAPCNLFWSERQVTATGPTTTLSLRLTSCMACGCVGETTCQTIRRGEVTRGAQSRVVTEPFDLVYTARHHNGDEELLVVLDPPLDGLYGVVALGPGWMDPAGTPGTLVLLGLDLVETSRETTSWVNQ
jgi:hypothetical protein